MKVQRKLPQTCDKSNSSYDIINSSDNIYVYHKEFLRVSKTGSIITDGIQPYHSGSDFNS
jgi:hypothetical protein